MIINGRAIAKEIVEHLAEERENFGDISLGVLMNRRDAATESFVRIKERVAKRLKVALVREELDENATTKDALVALEKLKANTLGLIVQLPLPLSVSTNEVLRAVPPELDVDGINPDLLDEERKVLSPVAEAVGEILARTHTEIHRRKIVVVGAGRLVGKPVAHLLARLGGVVTVLDIHDSLSALKEADIVVLGAGSPQLVKPNMLTRGVVLIDAGTSESHGKLAGDADPACAQVASLFTPVPGGVGPIAVAMIFKNLFGMSRKKPFAE